MSTSKGITPLDKWKREYPEVFKALVDQGWSVGMTRNSHLRFQTPDGKMLVGAGTPSARNSWKRIVTRLKREGLVLEEPMIKRPPSPIYAYLDDTADGFVAEEQPDYSVPVEAWTSGQTAQYLEATTGEVAEWRDAGYLEEAPRPAGRRGPGRYFWNTTVIEFANSDPFIQLRREHTKRVKKEPKKVESVEIESLRVVVTRRSMEILTPAELGAALCEAMRPTIEEAVRAALKKALREAFKGGA